MRNLQLFIFSLADTETLASTANFIHQTHIHKVGLNNPQSKL